MKREWPQVKVGTILQLQRRWLDPKPEDEYRQIGIRSFGKGIFHKPSVTGASLGNKRVLRICPGDLVFNNVFAWEGAVAVAGRAEDGMIGSHRFVTYTADPERADVGYLKRYFTSEVGRELLLHVSPGSAGRNRTLSLARLGDSEIPLPPLPEQRRIVARIEALAAKIEEARALRQQAAEECEILCRAILADTQSGEPTPTPLSELVTLRRPDVEVQQNGTYEFAGVYCFGRGVFRSQTKSGMEFAYRVLTRLRTGDFVYPKLMAWEGAFGVVPPECDGRVVSPEFPVFEVNQQRLRPEVLDVYFRDPSVWPLVAGESTGTNVRRRRLNPKDFLAFRFPLPVASVQDRLFQVRSHMHALKQLQSETAAELDALLPAILDKAFKGEL